MDANHLPPFLADLDRRVRAARQALEQALAECREAVEQVHLTLAQLPPRYRRPPAARRTGSPPGKKPAPPPLRG
jgi:hypothetical protein